VRTALISLSVAVIATLAGWSASPLHGAPSPTLDVAFSDDGSVTVTLPDGTAVGSSSGPPSVIPAGYYTVVLSGPEGCSESSYIEFHGPGVNIYGGLMNGEIATATYNAYFAPNSTYNWRNDQYPNIVYTFTTNSTVSGTAPTTTRQTSTKQAKAGQTLDGAAQSIVGENSVSTPFLGKLTGTVTVGRQPTLDFHGRRITRLTTGNYDVAVADHSTKEGFILQQTGQPPIHITSATFRGTHTLELDLTPGTWIIESSLTGKAARFTVHR
jgi:hypothetical protein